MPDQFIMIMWMEHCLVESATTVFRAWNAGNTIDTTPEREWLFVVGDRGLDKDLWQFDADKAEPVIGEGMMVRGRNAKRLADLLQTDAAVKAKLSAAEVVALRLYTGESPVLWPLSFHLTPALMKLNDCCSRDASTRFSDLAPPRPSFCPP